MSERRLVGITMVRDEDRFVEQAVLNALGACDDFVLVDHSSRDRTPQILSAIRAAFPDKVSLHRVRRAGEANLYLRPYVGQAVWVLGVDGDDLYEPARLAALRAALLRGDFEEFSSVKGNALHCTSLDATAGTASGYLSPPARSITKLRNFAALESWTGRAVEHLYGGELRMKAEFADRPVCTLGEEYTWRDSPFRCLHVCFLPRSSRQPAGQATRLSAIEASGLGKPERVRAAILSVLGRPPESAWKNEKYRQGELVTVDDVAGFFPSTLATTPST